MSKYNPTRRLPSQKYLSECFRYNRRTGVLTWKRRPRRHFPTERGWKRFNNRDAGTVAGTTKSTRYRDVGINGALYKVHRVIWKLVTGKEPPKSLDHKDGVRDNQRLTNLRPATRTTQRWNSCLHKNNRLRRRGVTQRGRKYMARINVRGVKRCLGCFDTIEAASAAYEEIARKLHGEFYRRQ